MSIQKNIGKNTIGDNKKMEVDLRTYNRSTHNLSTIVRNTQSAGTLVPTLTLVMQKYEYRKLSWLLLPFVLIPIHFISQINFTYVS